MVRSALRHRTSVAVAAIAAAALLLTGCGGQGGTEDESAPPASSAPEADQVDDKPADEEPEEEETEPAEEIVLEFGDESDQVRELQARLAQLDHFAADPTGYYGDVTVGAVAGFQEAQQLEVSGTVFESTWAAITELSTAPSQQELYPPQLVMGYGDNNDQVRELQARLIQLGHFDEKPTGYYGDVTSSAVRAFQQSAGIEATGQLDESTWSALKEQTSAPAQDDMFPPIEVPEVETPANLDERCMTGRALCISKTTNTLSWVIDGQVKTTMDVRFGTEEYPTREGEFDVYWKSRNHHSTLYDSPMPYAMFFDGGQAVHYSENFAANGYNGGSYGCVNVRDEAAIAALFDEVREGDKVIVHW
ncbi:peptidoglycan-binding protein [Streptomyces sp. XM4011]|uniref:L,D-transpeptidase family protein n=1 Tax=Streptomyces sp. XM4011 TaxID=2929780 RepID=UPI001FFAFF56|nr:peptidoglycan-binding protein [Streptomyces sp. XM4011]MCK1817397.1 peptidoglycan-binding protein [Streptomyces sp. XM4011]